MSIFRTCIGWVIVWPWTKYKLQAFKGGTWEPRFAEDGSIYMIMSMPPRATK